MSDTKKFLVKTKDCSVNCRFTVLLKDFKEAVTTAYITSVSKNNPNLTRIETFENTIKICTYNSISFSEYIIPAEIQTDMPEFSEVPNARFNLDLNMLVKIAGAFSGEENISFDVDMEHMIARVSCGNSTLELSIYPDTDFVDFSARMENAESKGIVDTEIIRKTIQFISQFAKKDDVQPNLSLLEFRNGQAVGGTVTALAYVKSEVFKFNLKLRFELLSQMDRFLTHFNNDVELFETKTHYILTDENILCGFEKIPYTFPPVEPIFNAPTDSRVLTIDRVSLLKSLTRLSIMSSIKDLIIHITTDSNGRMTLYTQDDKGRKSTDCIDVSVSDTENTEKSFNLILPILLKSLQGSSSEKITMKMIPDKLVILTDERSEGIFISIFSMVTGI